MKSGVFKRTALVAALASSGVFAHADALPFSFYALIDAGVVSTKVSGGAAGAGQTTEIRSSPIDPSFWGVIAEKKVGSLIGGLQLESTINVTNYTSGNTGGTPGAGANFGQNTSPTTLADRQANVYVKTDAAGKFEIGTITDPVFDALLKVDPTSSGFGNTLSPWFQFVGHSSDTGAMKYTSPTVSGFTGNFSYVAPKAANTTQNGSNATYGSGLRYAITYTAGDLTAVAAYEQNNSNGSTTVTAGTTQNTATVFGASYKIDAFTIKAIALINKDGVAANADYGSIKTAGFGGSYDFSDKVQLTTGYYTSKDGGSTNNNGTSVSAWDSYVTYEFIKDLKVYGQYANVTDTGTAASKTFNFNSNYGTWANNGGLLSGQAAKVFSVGLHYGFF